MEKTAALATAASAGRTRGPSQGFRGRAIRWAVASYSGAIIGCVPISVSCWNGGVRAVVGRFVTVETLHVVKDVGLGWLAAHCAAASARPWRALALLSGLVAGVGVVDEGLQGWLPQRRFQWSDVWLDWCGGALGFLGGMVGVVRGAVAREQVCARSVKG